MPRLTTFSSCRAYAKFKLTSTTVIPIVTTGGYAADPYSKSVVLLVSGDGTSGSTVFTDTSTVNVKTVSSVGASISSTANSGTGSIQLNGSSYLTSPYHSDYNFGRSDITIEAFIKPTVVSTSQMIFCQQEPNDGAALQLSVQANGVLTMLVRAAGGGAYYVAAGGSIVAGVWSHVAGVKSGNFIMVFVNGVLVAVTAIPDMNMSCVRPVTIGVLDDTILGQFFTGLIDDVRITKFPRYSANFVLGTNQFDGDGSYTKIITFGQEVAGGSSHIHAYNVSSTNVITSYAYPTVELFTGGYSGSWVGTNISRYNGRFITMWSGRDRFCIVYKRNTQTMTLDRVLLNPALTNQISDGGGSHLSGDGTYLAVQQVKPEIGYDDNGNAISDTDLLVYKYNGVSYDLFFSWHLPTDRQATCMAMSDDAQYIILASQEYTPDGDQVSATNVLKMNSTQTSYSSIGSIPDLYSYGYISYIATDSAGEWLVLLDDSNNGNFVYKRSGDAYVMHADLTNKSNLDNYMNTASVSCDGTTMVFSNWDNPYAYSINLSNVATNIPFTGFSFGTDTVNGKHSLSGDGKLITTTNVIPSYGFYYKRSGTAFIKNPFSYNPSQPLDVACSNNR